MKNILKLNPISNLVNNILDKDYVISDNIENPQGILVRSFEMHEYNLPDSVLAIARAGAGVNNIPSSDYAKKGVVVFNTPGANANAVCELVIASLLLGSRKIIPAIEWVKTLKGTEDISKTVEKGKKAFIGGEIKGKTLGIIGLGAIGCKVANAAIGLDMKVLGYDPFISVNSALHLSTHVNITKSLDEIYTNCDYITIHVPFTPENKNMINKNTISKMKNGAVIINCARGELANVDDVIEALSNGKLNRYITDFVDNKLIDVENAICIPHLGASTPEAEDNCAVMAANELKDYIENGNITNSVNYPNCSSPRASEHRITICHLNQQNMIAQFTTILAQEQINIDNFVNSSKGDFAYSIIDIPSCNEDIITKLSSIEGVIKVRLI